MTTCGPSDLREPSGPISTFPERRPTTVLVSTVSLSGSMAGFVT